MVAEREIPARQWTRTLALQALAFSDDQKNKTKKKKINQAVTFARTTVPLFLFNEALCNNTEQQEKIPYVGCKEGFFSER